MSDTLASVTDGMLTTESGSGGSATNVVLNPSNATVVTPNRVAATVDRLTSQVVVANSSQSQTVTRLAQGNVVVYRESTNVVTSGC